MEVITVDKHFIAQAVTVAMQMRGELEEEDYIVVNDMAIDEDTGYLHIVLERVKATIN